MTTLLNKDVDPKSSDTMVTELPSQLIPVDLNYLIPYAKAPCSIFLFFQGKFIECVAQDKVVSLVLFGKCLTEFMGLGFVKKSSQKIWEEWVKQRDPIDREVETYGAENISSQARRNAPGNSIILKNKKSFLQYATSKIVFLAKTDLQQESVKTAEAVLREATNSPMLEWYFAKGSAESDPLICHCARVTYMALLFANTTFKGTQPYSISLELLALSCMIHELEGDPTQIPKQGFSSGRTLEILQEKGNLIPQEVKDIIQQQDELFDGSGLPNKLKLNEINPYARIFSFFNVYDHLRLKSTGGTRRMRLDRTRTQMLKRRSQFDPNLWALFWTFRDSLDILE